MNWNTPIRYISMVGPIYQKRLEKLEIATVFDLLFHAPTRYDDFSRILKISELQSGVIATVIGNVISIKNIYTKRYKQIQKIVIADQSGHMEAVWFNQPYITQTIKTGETIALCGKAELEIDSLKFQSPEYEIVKEGKPLIHCGRIIPIYPQTEGVSSKWLRSRIAPLLRSPIFSKDYLPSSIINKYSLLTLEYALNTLHFPINLAQVETARHRLSFDELFLLQLNAKMQRLEWQQHYFEKNIVIDEGKISKFTTSLPFKLTNSQQHTIQEIMADLTKKVPMNRLLQGDVGSGKTVVAAAAIYAIYLNQMRSVCMTPTEILAQQHYVTLTKILTPFGLKVAIRTSSEKKDDLKNFDVLVGTHALIQKNVQLTNIGLIVIDEQHKFGVRQRAMLRNKGKSPHILTMTATPIPRTVALTVHGDLDLSYIDEMPVGRIPVKTWVVPKEKRLPAYEWIRKQIKSKPRQQAFILCPFIEISETLKTVKSAKEEFKKLKSEIFPDLRLGLLHGKMKVTEKEAEILKFREGNLDILVCTPIVEVGIDIPNATIMLIEAAQRFGLAQLHQLRGRVGRGNLQSYCLLFSANSENAQIKRLKYLENTYSGRKLAEIDLKIRGAGKLFGTEQHGKDMLKIASYADTSLVHEAQLEAEILLKEDPKLVIHPLLKQRLSSGTITDISPD